MNGEPPTTDPMLQHRLQQEADAHSRADANPMSSLVTVELNIMDACNRTCAFCPHADAESYPNRTDWRMGMEVPDRVGSQLARMRYVGRVSLSGYGEPMMHIGVYDIVRLLRVHFAAGKNVIEMNTNGDVLNVERVQKLMKAGLTYLYVNCYDGPQQLPLFTEMMAQAGMPADRYRLRSRWKSGDGYALIGNNRGGALDAPELGYAPLAEPKRTPCWYPAYKMFVDWNGDVLGCSNDWRRTTVVGNVLHRPLDELWLSPSMKKLRGGVFYGDRDNAMCRRCDVHGTLHGRKSVDVLVDHYGWDKP